LKSEQEGKKRRPTTSDTDPGPLFEPIASTRQYGGVVQVARSLDELLRFHGDAEASQGLVDLAVNVRSAPMPTWLAEPIVASLADLARYPDQSAALDAVAARHGRPTTEVMLTSGASQAFTAIAHAFARARRPLVVHPQFTEPDASLRSVGLRPERLVLDAADGFRFDPSSVPDEADLVMIGNPTNPTSVAHPADAIAKLTRPGRLVVVDEAFADTIPGEPTSLADRRDLPGLVVIRSLTKTWGLAGLRAGYLVAAAETIAELVGQQPLWPVSTPALTAIIACVQPRAVAAADEIAAEVAAERGHLLRALAGVPSVELPAESTSSFVLVRVPDGARVRAGLRERGFAVRRGDTFPGLGLDWLRVTVRDTACSDAFVAALRDCLTV
jgi:histidinol-phosphate aminotransferase